jgi:PAS domain S-box-containing protein
MDIPGSENLYKEIVTNMLEGVMVISMKGRLTMLNSAAEKILGIGQDRIGDLYVNIFLDKEDNDALSEAILNTIYQKKKVSNMPVDYVLDGEIKNLSVTTSYIQNQGEKSVVVVIDDETKLTELKDARIALEKITRLNHEYEKAKNEAELANSAKSRFLSNMSHEIRTPINAVLGMNEMILRECNDSQLLTYAANIESSGKTLLFLINDILDMSKIESGKMEIITVDYEPANLIMDLWNVIYFRAQEKDLALKFSIDETLPSKLYGDDVRIKQIVTNLLTNAVKYTPEGEVNLKLSYEKQDDDNISLVISVKDTGMGIKEEDMGKLFESFQRLDEKKNRNIEGTGLGMNITMSLLKMMNGEMKVESEYQKGSEFTVIIPQRIVDSSPIGDFEAIKKKHESQRRVRGAAFEAPDADILVVDDNAMNLTVFKSLLKRNKMNIVTASSGRECLELAKQKHFNIIFMDHMMPDMDGVETLHELQKMSDGPNALTPVIALTANAVSGVKEFYLNEGFSDFLTKPIDSALLEQTIYDYLPKEIVKIVNEDNKEAEKAENKTANEIDFEDYLSYGISIKTGLSYAKEDMDAYLELVRLFIAERDMQDKLKGFISDRNMKEYGVLVHALKGNARTLGADTLADIAYKHEMESKAGNCEYVEGDFDKLLNIWNKSLEGFEKFYGIYGKNEAYVQKTDGELLELTGEDFEKAALLIENFETEKALDCLKEWINSPLDKKVYEKIKKALTAIEDDFDEDKAMEVLRMEEF